MKVKFKRTWFYPIEAGPVNDRRVISGGRYRKGVHDVPESLRDRLPKDAEILDKKVEEQVEPDHRVTLQDFDDERSASDAFVEMAEKAEQARVAIEQTKKRGPGRPRKT